jgi:hypothetical protein
MLFVLSLSLSVSLCPEIYEPVDWLLQTWYGHYDSGFFLIDVTF